ncbi:MAG: hypothetical protein ACI9SB_000563 [Candidatus Azotimanducaceae bacterium]|jgi:hypothetical protein
MHRLTTKAFPLVALLTVLLGLAACGTDEGFIEPINVPTGFLRVVNTIPEAPQLANLIQGNNQATLNFSDSSPFFSILPSLSREYRVLYSVDGETLTLLSRDLTVGINDQRSLILAGTLDSPVVIDILNAPLTTNTDDFVELTIVHAANNYPAEVGFILVKDGNFGAATTSLLGQFTPSLTLNPALGTGYELFAVSTLPAAGAAPADANILWRSGLFDFPANARPLLVLMDYFGPGGQTVKVNSISPQGTLSFALENTPTAVRVVNTIPDQGPIDVYLNDELFLANPAFGVVNDYKITDLSGVGTFKITPAGDPATVLLEIAPTVSQGLFYSLAISGLASDASYAMALFPEDNRAIPSRMIISGVSASPSAPALLDYYLLESGQTLDGINPLSFNNSRLSTSSFIALPGAYDLVITESGAKTALAGPLPINITNNAIYRFFVTDAPGGGTPPQVVFTDDFL